MEDELNSNLKWATWPFELNLYKIKIISGDTKSSYELQLFLFRKWKLNN